LISGALRPNLLHSSYIVKTFATIMWDGRRICTVGLHKGQ